MSFGGKLSEVSLLSGDTCGHMWVFTRFVCCENQQDSTRRVEAVKCEAAKVTCHEKINDHTHTVNRYDTSAWIILLLVTKRQW